MIPGNAQLFARAAGIFRTGDTEGLSAKLRKSTDLEQRPREQSARENSLVALETQLTTPAIDGDLLQQNGGDELQFDAQHGVVDAQLWAILVAIHAKHQPARAVAAAR
ncbi:hypothetical protein PTMSG1_07039 [Pyrenophora teres f. maculata]|nr:hypothetical protein PTMSG1_07039 [Pyrenophora teres f. maculata]